MLNKAFCIPEIIDHDVIVVFKNAFAGFYLLAFS